MGEIILTFKKGEKSGEGISTPKKDIIITFTNLQTNRHRGDYPYFNKGR
jgi:hypothetical protein